MTGLSEFDLSMLPEFARNEIRRRNELSKTQEGRMILEQEDIASREEQEREFAAERAQQEIKWAIEAFKSSGVPLRITEDIRDGLKPTDALSAVNGWSGKPRSDPWCLLLLGSVGIGKSTAAASWLREVMAHSKMWIHGFDLAVDSMDQDERRRALSVEALVIDELGAEYADKAGIYLANLDKLIGVRCANKRATIITSNLTWENFRSRYGERIESRVILGKIYGLKGDDMRRAKR